MTSKLTLTRRDILRYTAAASASAMLPRMAFAQNNDAWKAVEEAARKEGKVVMYYSGVPIQRAETFINAWSERYPDIKMEYVEVSGSATIGRVLQESLAGGPTCDVTTNTLGVVDGLIKQDILQAIDWKSYGMEPTLQQNPNPYCFATHATTYCTMFNTNQVKENEVPKTAEDLTDPKWTGRWGTWSRPLGILTMIGAWGEEKTTEYVHKLAATKPRLFTSGAAWTDACTSGQIDLVTFIPTYTTVAPIASGAPGQQGDDRARAADHRIWHFAQGRRQPECRQGAHRLAGGVRAALRWKRRAVAAIRSIPTPRPQSSWKASRPPRWTPRSKPRRRNISGSSKTNTRRSCRVADPGRV